MKELTVSMDNTMATVTMNNKDNPDSADSDDHPFEEQLAELDEEWSKIMGDVKTTRKETEAVAKKWWDFSKSKQKMVRWLKRKEDDMTGELDTNESMDSAVEQANKYKVKFFFPFVFPPVISLCLKEFFSPLMN